MVIIISDYFSSSFLLIIWSVLVFYVILWQSSTLFLLIIVSFLKSYLLYKYIIVIIIIIIDRSFVRTIIRYEWETYNSYNKMKWFIFFFFCSLLLFLGFFLVILPNFSPVFPLFVKKNLRMPCIFPCSKPYIYGEFD